MDTHTYERAMKKTKGGDSDLFWGLGLAEEAGEVAGLIKKLNFHGGGDKKGPITPARILEECGDVLWYLTATLNHFGFTLEDCMEHNLAKLAKRHPSGFTHATAQAHADER